MNMQIFVEHKTKFDTSYVMGNYCINGCQTFTRDSAVEVYKRFNVPQHYQDEINNAFGDFIEPNIDEINWADGLTERSYQLKLLMLNGMFFDEKFLSDLVINTRNDAVYYTLLAMKLKTGDTNDIDSFLSKLKPLTAENIISRIDNKHHLIEHHDVLSKYSNIDSIPYVAHFFMEKNKDGLLYAFNNCATYEVIYMYDTDVLKNVLSSTSNIKHRHSYEYIVRELLARGVSRKELLALNINEKIFSQFNESIKCIIEPERIQYNVWCMDEVVDLFTLGADIEDARKIANTLDGSNSMSYIMIYHYLETLFGSEFSLHQKFINNQL